MFFQSALIHLGVCDILCRDVRAGLKPAPTEAYKLLGYERRDREENEKDKD
jgi:hypothetical protein